MQYINWNGMSKLGLIERINREILHPLGIAMTRNVEDGISSGALISDDGIWEYAPSVETTVISDDAVRNMIPSLIMDSMVTEDDIASTQVKKEVEGENAT